MKLFEMYNIEPRFAWLEPAIGPNGIRGVRLAFIEPIEPKFDSQIEDALNKKNEKKKEQIELRKQNYLSQGQKFLTPDLGWWLSEQHFNNGESNAKGFTKGNILQKYPDLMIFPSKEDAVKAAHKAKII